ncbi:SH2 domain-containing protein 3C-like [Tachypleus tridentatus]|uniref:SH2 domain-containing protein 3C-like n=1 Tax=Tachypleus tridentatus TaxID=6853 RepID=UPI003FD36A60
MTSQLFQETGKNIPSLPPFLPAKLTNSDGGYVRKLSVPDKNPTSVFCLSTFSTVLLIPENKPLDSLSKVKVSTLLKNNEAKTLAIHLTKNDLDVLKYTNDYDLGLGVRNGLELLTLPQGEQLRIDLIERSECLKYLVAVTILTSESSLERAELVSKWIGVAVDCKTSLGNLYGFSGIMKGLSLPQISRLQNTWLVLRQNFTENAVIYESKMRPFLKSLEINPETEVLNSCIPYIMCLISVLQRHLKVSKLTERPPEIETNSKDAQPVTSVMLPWEYTTADYGLQMLMNHLELGRMVAREIDTYQKKCKTYMNNKKYDDQLLDLFRTEFHLKFLWGTKGAKALSDDRYSKLEQVLSLLSQNREAS